ncbi:3-hydroxyacyl-ACP dehydratase FabZ family protein [Kitasatospora sp. NPDC001261]|uniref:3-hydroxyacyl-ACP dehydratase FabZ family protein n=1 Tax=Kitasatospora sp. NPDC001261 TaxID=3364012 RepID=UPI0036A8BF9D
MKDIAAITSVVPHRHPALLVDRIAEIEPGRRLVAYKAVTLAEPAYRDVPEDAANEEYDYPLGQLLESWAQCAVLLSCWERPNANVLDGQVVLLARTRDVRMLGPVRPGSVVVHEVTMVRALGDSFITSGRSTVDGHPVLEVGQLTLALRPAELLRAPGSTTDGRS